MDNNTILISILAILIIGIVGFGIKSFKKYHKKDGGFDVEPQEFLKDFTALVISLCQNTIKVLSETKGAYKTEKELKDALIDIVAEDLKNELCKSEFKQIALMVPKEEYVKFITVVFDQTESLTLKGLTKKEKATKKQPEAKKVDISKEINQLSK